MRKAIVTALAGLLQLALIFPSQGGELVRVKITDLAFSPAESAVRHLVCENELAVAGASRRVECREPVRQSLGEAQEVGGRRGVHGAGRTGLAFSGRQSMNISMGSG